MMASVANRMFTSLQYCRVPKNGGGGGGGTALQPGPFLFSPNLADFVLISSAHLVLISSAHACTCMYNHVHVHVLHQNSFLTHFSSLSTFLNFGEIPAWPFFGKPFFGTRQYCNPSGMPGPTVNAVVWY